LGNESVTDFDTLEREKGMPDEEIFEDITGEVQESGGSLVAPSKSREYFGSFLLFLWEQKPQWRWYCLMLIGAVGAGGNLGKRFT